MLYKHREVFDKERKGFSKWLRKTIVTAIAISFVAIILVTNWPAAFSEVAMGSFVGTAGYVAVSSRSKHFLITAPCLSFAIIAALCLALGASTSGLTSFTALFIVKMGAVVSMILSYCMTGLLLDFGRRLVVK